MRHGVGFLFLYHIKVEIAKLNQAKLDRVCGNTRDFWTKFCQQNVSKTVGIAYQQKDLY